MLLSSLLGLEAGTFLVDRTNVHLWELFPVIYQLKDLMYVALILEQTPKQLSLSCPRLLI